MYPNADKFSAASHDLLVPKRATRRDLNLCCTVRQIFPLTFTSQREDQSQRVGYPVSKGRVLSNEWGLKARRGSNRAQNPGKTGFNHSTWTLSSV